MNQAAFLKHEQILTFLLVSGTAFLIAAQIALVVLCKYLLANEENNKLILRDLKIFFYIQFVLLVLVAVFGFLASLQDDMRLADPMKKAILATKWAVCAFICVNYAYMWHKYMRAKAAFLANDPIEVGDNLVLIAYYFTPLNIVLCIFHIYLGIAFRDF